MLLDFQYTPYDRAERTPLMTAQNGNLWRPFAARWYHSPPLIMTVTRFALALFLGGLLLNHSPPLAYVLQK